METTAQEIREKARHHVHAHMIEIADLRRSDETQLRGELLRTKIGAAVRETLARFSPVGSLAEDSSFVAELVDEIIGLGPIERLLRDPSVTEIMVNGPSDVFVERNGRIERTGAPFAGESSLRAVIARIVAPLSRRIDESSPMVDARLADGSRVNVIIPPLSLNGPILTIRKFSRDPLSIATLIDLGSISKVAATFLEACVRGRRNLLIAGGTGSGKTTLLNALAGFIPSGERIVTIEDAAELRLPQDHVISLEARPPNVEGRGEITIRDLVRNALRMRPDRIVVGECRGGEALDMLQAMNTGHDGSMTTAHANSPRDSLLRIETMVLMAGLDLPLRAIRDQIAGALDLIVFVARQRDGTRAITQITEVCGTEEGTIVTQNLFHRSPGNSNLESCHRLPRFAEHLSPQEREAFAHAVA
ncbi:MAG: CpaF family protein [Pseudomonadota bacterium]